jgi:hypothetical protein
MERVDAQKELDTLFSGLDDVVHYIGIIHGPHSTPEKPEKIAYARLIFDVDGQLRPLPEKLVYRRAIEAVSGVEMFAIYEPGPEGILDPLVATEWDETYTHFIDAAVERDFFVVETVTPTKKRVASVRVQSGLVSKPIERSITPEEYEFLKGAHRPLFTPLRS